MASSDASCSSFTAPPKPDHSPLKALPSVSDRTAIANDIMLNMVIRQNPFSITLDALAMLVAALLLVTGMHVLQPSLLEVIIIAVPLVLLVRNDYINFLLLGPGGTPPTFSGYLRLLWFRLFALRDVYHSQPPSDTVLAPAAGILKELPYRPGPRPIVAGLAPQRQLNQPASGKCNVALRSAVEDLTRQYPDSLCTATSCIEKHGFGLFARHPVNVWGQGEVFHIHDSEKSMHMSLHPDDIKEVLEKGWGQRHPLAFKGWVKAPLPITFVMIYAPRDESDLKIIAKIVEAAIWYTIAKEVRLEIPPLSSQESA
ncbi:hypothetical protein CMQ_5909 [Grosmannia clavigera kw1407]|uniref:Luciferase domain-containing protein n=1 Tax=Grosmannia clavigera (strain kw1407 / UAMH 11150) TaxID=655863 RepID=F0XIF1_GROCL|nr:uncharacterized protein CMQ_5909 [Grosmannia clavigera kw1407]EFX02548.1 hypothetical protein CMQ_5909 [Grosmannia clavigera kw1407]